jgi:hypothetical protein
MILESQQRLQPFPHYTTERIAVILPDHAAGSPRRYTVYSMPASPNVSSNGGVRVVGRELSLDNARKIARDVERAGVKE